MKQKWDIPVVDFYTGTKIKHVIEDVLKKSGVKFDSIVNSTEEIFLEECGFVPYVDVCIKKDVEIIPEWAFQDICVIRNVFDEPGSRLYKIAYAAFSGASLCNLSLTNSFYLETIREIAFKPCDKLDEVSLSSNCEFLDCDNESFDEKHLRKMILYGDTFLGVNVRWLNSFYDLTIHTDNKSFITRIQQIVRPKE